MGHMDVVGADTAKWTSPPFQPVERDGYLYGRGTIDDKGALAATAVAMRLLAARRDSLDRDIILLGTAAEESGGDQGISRILKEHFDLIKDAEFALNEGGRVRLRKGRVYSINVQVTEKISYAVIATARGTSGHGSVPLPDNAIAALSRALAPRARRATAGAAERHHARVLRRAGQGRAGSGRCDRRCRPSAPRALRHRSIRPPRC